jgi:N-methylhydantoinase A
MDPNNSRTAGPLIGVDVGGTHTDVQILHYGKLVRGKSLTTYDDFSRGLLSAIGVGAGELGLTLGDVLENAQLVTNATTVVTNAVTELRGERVGALVTRGFRDTFRFAGGPRLPVFDDHLQLNPPVLVPREAIVEVDGRIDARGAELVPLDEDEIAEAARYLVEEAGVEAIAICFLSSYANPAHEVEAARIVAGRYPGTFLTMSHRLLSVLRETRRWTTAVLNCFVEGTARRYLETVDDHLRAAGLKGSLAFFQGLGGDISKERAMRFPLALLGSGPAAGASAANELARRMGCANVLLADMGGTSFDVGVILDNQLHIDKRVDIGQLQTGVSLVDVVSIGAGGGSIVSLSERGVPLVGPRSAGSTPGPACYGMGGVEPTVTDASVTLGLIDPDNYLGGRIELDRDLAIAALERGVADEMGWTVDRAACSVYELVVANMANAIREVTVQKGHSPREFLFLAYGGSLGLFASAIATMVGLDEVVIPNNSSVFCAQGLLTSNTVLRFDRSLRWRLDDTEGVERVNDVAAEMVDQVYDEYRNEGAAVDPDRVSVARWADFQFDGQAFELSLPMPDSLTPERIPELTAAFLEKYERTYGEGTRWRDVPIVLTSYTVELTVAREPVELASNGRVALGGEVATKGTRQVCLPESGRRCDVPVVDGPSFAVGGEVLGPAIIDNVDTTIYVPEDVRASRDELSNIWLRREVPA